MMGLLTLLAGHALSGGVCRAMSESCTVGSASEQSSWVQLPALPFTHCVAVSKSPDLAGPVPSSAGRHDTSARPGAVVEGEVQEDGRTQPRASRTHLLPPAIYRCGSRPPGSRSPPPLVTQHVTPKPRMATSPWTDSAHRHTTRAAVPTHTTPGRASQAASISGTV